MRGRRWGRLLAGIWAGLALAAPAAAQPLLPEAPGPFREGRLEGARASPVLPGYEGFGDLGGLGLPFGGIPLATGRTAAAPGPAPAWSLTPSIGLELLATDNARGTVRDRRADFVTTLSPALDARAETARLTGRLSYAPLLRHYAESGEVRLDHRFSGQGLATLVQDRLFLDLRGYGGLQSLGGGYLAQDNLATNRRDLVQTVNLQASPYLVHRFGTLAVAQLGYSYQYSSVSGRRAFLPGSARPYFTDQETNAHTGYALIRSGEEFGRLVLESRTVGTVYEGDGVLDGAHRLFTSVQALYALTRQVALLAEGGYEDQHYGGTRPLDIQGPIWSVGVRLTPGPDSILILRYGRRNGYESFSLDASVYVGVRTRVFATYADQLGTPGQLAGDLLSGASFDAYGNPVSGLTGAPLAAPFGSSLLATQSSLQRVKRATAGISQAWPRDTITLFSSYEDRSPLTSEPGTVGFAQKGYFVGLTWGRALTPVLNGFASVRYGRTESPTALGASDVYGLSLGLSQELAPGLFGSLRYLYANRGSDFDSGRAVQNTVVLALRKFF